MPKNNEVCRSDISVFINFGLKKIPLSDSAPEESNFTKNCLVGKLIFCQFISRFDNIGVYSGINDLFVLVHFKVKLFVLRGVSENTNFYSMELLAYFHV